MIKKICILVLILSICIVAYILQCEPILLMKKKTFVTSNSIQMNFVTNAKVDLRPFVSQSAPGNLIIKSLSKDYVPLSLCQAETAYLNYDFWMSSTPILEAQYASLMPNKQKKNNPIFPVTNVSYEDARLFCKRLTEQEIELNKIPSDYEYRLPLQIEWFYCALLGKNWEEEYENLIQKGENIKTSRFPLFSPASASDFSNTNEFNFYGFKDCIEQFSYETYDGDPPSIGMKAMTLLTYDYINSTLTLPGVVRTIPMNEENDYIGFRIVLSKKMK